jgi:hypothetical protein
VSWWLWLIVAVGSALVYVGIGAFIYGLMESRVDPLKRDTLDDWAAPFATFWPIWCVVAPIVAVLKRFMWFAMRLGQR